MIASRKSVEILGRIVRVFARGVVAIASAIEIARGRVDFPRIVVALFLRRGGERVRGNRVMPWFVFIRAERGRLKWFERGDVRGAAACIGEVTFRFLFSTKFKTGTADEAIGESPAKDEKL